MRVFLTGASGFIGSQVVRALIQDHEVTALALPNDPLVRLKEVVRDVTIAYGSLADRKSLRAAIQLSGPDVCIHLAWYAEPGRYLHSDENLGALEGSLNLIDELAAAGCSRLVAAGTCAEYDTTRGLLTEETPTRPTTLYAATKLACFLIAEQLCNSRNMEFAWARIFYPYGPDEDVRRVIPALIQSLRNNKLFPATRGEQIRDYIYVEDVASAFRVLAEARVNGVFNIASGVPVSMSQIMRLIAAEIGRLELIQFGALPYREWDPMFICGDNRKLKALGWVPRYSLEEGIKQTCRWWTDGAS